MNKRFDIRLPLIWWTIGFIIGLTAGMIIGCKWGW